jgi:hypothetical protein
MDDLILIEKAKYQALIEVLKFYADSESYSSTGVFERHLVDIDGGARAIAVLKMMKESEWLG